MGNVILKASMFVYELPQRLKKDEQGITAIEYAIIGVAMASALFFIFDKGGFIESLKDSWGHMQNKINAAKTILK